MQITGDIAVDYRVKATWTNSSGVDGKIDRIRITPTRIQVHGTWQIIGGMSSPVNAAGQ